MAPYELNETEAFRAMALFVNRFAARPGNDLGMLLADIDLDTGLWPDGGPVDPAAWDDWVECVRAVKTGGADGGGAQRTP